MGNQSLLQETVSPATYEKAPASAHLVRQGILRLLEIKDSDIRMLTLEQCRDAVDKGLHSGGAFSATVPLVALYYGGFMNYDVAEPTKRGQDMFVLSKGHAVAAMASIYAELGYFDRSVLKNSRSYESILNGHPGPILPGVHFATGPLGQGFSLAEGLALAGRTPPRFDVFCMTGDGELQEGLIWEAVMYSANKRLDNLCVMVDQNHGQLDVYDRMVFSVPHLSSVFKSFGWQVHVVDSTQYAGVYAALDAFKNGPRNGKPTVIICDTSKGEGGFSSAINKHKSVIQDDLMAQEMELQNALRDGRIEEFRQFYAGLSEPLQETFVNIARRMHISIVPGPGESITVTPVFGPTVVKRAPVRDKKIRYDDDALPKIEKDQQYAAASIITAAMKVFARDQRVISIDADLASTSGLEVGVSAVDQKRGLNVGVAEANMSLIGEAFAALGSNVWTSTFCPFWDWKVLRRIAVGQQEREEAIEAPDGWLSEGHGLDMTLVATAPNFETKTNGATHMGNDDVMIFDGLAHLKIVDVSCPQQLLSIMKWIMDGNRGLIYVRVMRSGSAVLYDSDFEFDFGRGYVLREGAGDKAVIVSSGRGVHEALATAEECAKDGLGVGVVDMPSVDEELMLKLYDSGKVICFAEQNNGFLWQNFRKVLFRHRDQIDAGRLMAVNTLDKNAQAQFIHSATYGQLLKAFELSPAQLAETIKKGVKG